MLFPIFVLGLVTKKTEITNTELALVILAFTPPSSCEYPITCRKDGECANAKYVWGTPCE